MHNLQAVWISNALNEEVTYAGFLWFSKEKTFEDIWKQKGNEK